MKRTLHKRKMYRGFMALMQQFVMQNAHLYSRGPGGPSSRLQSLASRFKTKDLMIQYNDALRHFKNVSEARYPQGQFIQQICTIDEGI
jgi:hypothetical protein